MDEAADGGERAGGGGRSSGNGGIAAKSARHATNDVRGIGSVRPPVLTVTCGAAAGQ